MRNAKPLGHPLVALAFLAGLLVVSVPTYWDMAQKVWSTEEQSHGPVILAIAVWLIWRVRSRILALPVAESALPGLAVLFLAVVLYVIGRSQLVVQLEALAVIAFLAAAGAMAYGSAILRLVWFPLFLLLFTIPLPGVLVQSLTVPLKGAVSFVAEGILYQLGYPIARTGVILQVGQYQLLVADACAGLTSIFTLEAIGLVYLELMKYRSRWRNALLAVMVVPCAFAANVVRVCVLVLITYHFGSEAGQGFTHGFAGILLFAVAVFGVILIDRVLSVFFDGPVVRVVEGQRASWIRL